MKMTSKIWGAILIFLLVLGGSYFFYLQHRPQPAPVKIYRAPLPALREMPRTSVPAERDDTQALEGSRVSTELDTMPREESTFMQSAPIDIGTTELADEEVSIPAAVQEEITTEEAAAWMIEQFERLNAEFKQNYPDIAMLTELTLEEINELYPTDAAREALRERALSAQDEFFADFYELFSVFPSNVREQIFYDLEQELTVLLGAEFMAIVMAEIREGMQKSVKE